MKKSGITRAATALMLSIVCVSSLAQTAAPQSPGTEAAVPLAGLVKQAQEALDNEDWERYYAANQSLHERLPFVPQYSYNMVIAASHLGNRTDAYNAMLIMQQQGMSFDFDQVDATASVRGTQAYEYINDLMVEAGNPVGEGSLAFELAGDPGDFGDIAWDESRGRFLVGTRREGKLLAVDGSGSTEVLLQADNENGLWAIMGIAVDAGNRRLWISSSTGPEFRGFSVADRNHGALFEFDLGTLELINRYNQPVDAFQHRLGRLAVTSAGDVYVIDRRAPIVYRRVAGGEKLEPFIASNQFTGLTDVAVTPDNSRLFVADTVRGVLLVDPLSNSSAPLSGPENLNQFGISNLEYENGNLIVTQGRFPPPRIMRWKMDAAGAAVESIAPMAVALTEFKLPRQGTVHGGNLYYFANSGTDAEALAVFVTPMDSGKEIEPPDMRQFEKAMQEKLRQQQEAQEQ
jgi:hypothetical protein